MTYKEIIKSIKDKSYKPVYFLHGAEPFYIDKISDFIENNVLAEMEKAFNQTIIYGREATFHAIVDNARRYPMGAERQVIIVKEAQEMKELAKLESYFENPSPSTILVFAHKHKKLAKNTKVYKALAKKSLIFESKKLYDNQVPSWIKDYFTGKKRKINDEAMMVMAEFLGNDLSKLSNEADKMLINIPGDAEITASHVTENIGISKEYNIFELQAALGTKNKLKIQRIVNYFISNPKKNPLVVIVGSLYSWFAKIYISHFFKHASDKELGTAINVHFPRFIKEYRNAAKKYNKPKTEEIISILREYDLRSKGLGNDGTPESELLKEMIWRIVN